MSQKELVKGPHCFKCLHFEDYTMEERIDDVDIMRIMCVHDDGGVCTYREEVEYTGPEHEICVLFEVDKKYLEFRRKLYGRE